MSTDTPSDQPESAQPTANSDNLTGLRLGLALALGNSGFDDRDRYDTFGWLTDPDPEDYLALYLRNGYARTVVDKPALTTWRDAPRVVDDADQEDDTEFEDAVTRLAREHNVWDYATRVDRLAGIGQHGLLVFGLSDTDDPSDFSTDASDASFEDGLDAIQTLRVYHEDQIEEIEWGGPGTGRWGKPVEYQIDLGEDVDESTEDNDNGTLHVHWSRVVDVPATRLLDDETLGRPRMEPVLNNLIDIEKTLGSVAEMAYRGADKGLHLDADPAKVDTSKLDDLDDELQRWYHDAQPWLKTQGVEVENLGGEVADPEGIIEPNLDEIAATTGIPKRELRGNQQGEQAGADQDEKSYFGMIEERREQYAAPYIVREVLDRLRDLGILPAPLGPTYDVTWPDLTQLSEAEQAALEQDRSEVVANLATVVPDLRGERAEAYVESGEFSDRDTQRPAGNDLVDESSPAVQDQFSAQFGANADVDLTPPEGAQENARKVLRWREEHPEEIEGMTEVGWRRARQLADGGALPPGVVKKMAQFNRHRENGDLDGEHQGEPWKDAGYVAWLGWGGDVGIDWAIRKSDQLTEADT